MLKIDNAKCIACGACARACPIGAVLVAKNQSEHEKNLAAIEADPHRREDLFVEKLGADPVADPIEDVDSFVKTNPLACIELKQEEIDWACQIKSINISDLITPDIKYASVVGAKKLFGVSVLPALVFFKNGEVIGKTEGYFENSETETAVLKKKVKEILD